MRVLANDERLCLVRLLMRGPATLTQLGAEVGHHPAWVRHHLLSLKHAGLVELVETRATKGYVEKISRATAHLALDLLATRLRDDAAAPDVVTMAMGSSHTPPRRM